jgi:hypothetical protein
MSERQHGVCAAQAGGRRCHKVASVVAAKKAKDLPFCRGPEYCPLRIKHPPVRSCGRRADAEHT